MSPSDIALVVGSEVDVDGVSSCGILIGSLERPVPAAGMP